MTPDADKPVLGLFYESDNDALKWATWGVQYAFARMNIPVILLDLRIEKDFTELYHRLQSGRCSFAFGYQGVGSQLTVGRENLWTKARVPFLALHYDHPCHRIENHLTRSPYIMNLYAFSSQKDAFERYIAPLLDGPRLSGLLPPTLSVATPAPTPYNDRPISFLFLKNGGSTAPYLDHINALPIRLRNGAHDLIARARENPNLSLCDEVAALFDPATFRTPDVQVEYWALIKAIDLLIRLQRATHFVEWLKMQPGAVICGNGWDHIERKHACAEFRDPTNTCHGSLLYDNARIVCNTNPYGADIVHERPIMGLVKGACVLSDANSWWRNAFPTQPALHLFDWHAPLEDQIRPFLNAPPAPERVTQSGMETLAFFRRQELAPTILHAANQMKDWLTARGL